jgi:hypothetical protein
MAKPALDPKVILSAGVRPALKRAGLARHSGYDHSFIDGGVVSLFIRMA